MSRLPINLLYTPIQPPSQSADFVPNKLFRAAYVDRYFACGARGCRSLPKVLVPLFPVTTLSGGRAY